MWILFLLATFASVIAFNTKHQRAALLIITFLATSAFQLVSARWFASPVILSKPYDYAYLAILLIFLLNTGTVLRAVRSERVSIISTAYLFFILFVLIGSVVFFQYSAVQAFQTARFFLWPLFLLLFLITDPAALGRFVKSLRPIVLILSVLYLLQPLTGTNIINPDSVYFNPYLGATDLKRYLATPDFLVFFLMLFYYEICTSKEKTLGIKLARWLGLGLLMAVQLVSFTRSAIAGTGLVLVYLSKRLLNSLAVGLFLISIVVAAAVGYSTSSTVETRIDESWKDITSTLSGDYLTWRAGKDGNLSFRLAHFSERAAYVSADVRRWPIGVGFIHEDSAAAQDLGFKIGLQNPYTGRVVQVDTGDIAWSIIVIKTGYLGLALLLLLLLVSFFSVAPSAERYATVYRGGLFYFLLTSFFSINFVMPAYMIPLTLFLALAIHERQAIASRTSETKKTIPK